MIHFLLQCAVVGFLAYLILTYIPMPPVIKTALTVFVVVVVVLWAMQILGITDLPFPTFGNR